MSSNKDKSKFTEDEMKQLSQLSENIYKMLSKRNMTVSDLAKYSGVSKTHVYMIMWQRHQPSILCLAKFCQVLNCQLNDLLTIDKRTYKKIEDKVYNVEKIS